MFRVMVWQSHRISFPSYTPLYSVHQEKLNTPHSRVLAGAQFPTGDMMSHRVCVKDYRGLPTDSLTESVIFHQSVIFKTAHVSVMSTEQGLDISCNRKILA